MNKSVALVLSSGGARGVAHIGVIEELERQGFEIKSIAGSSMGALVGGMYATGKMNIYKEWMCNLDKKAVFNLVDLTLSNKGLVKGNKVIKEIKKIVPDIPIEELPISFTAVASDVKNRQEIVFDKGSLYKAIRASISIPAFFTPLKTEDKVLVDGGVLNPLPINRIKRFNNDLLITVDINSSFPLFNKTTAKKTTRQNNKDFNLLSLIREKTFLPKTNGDQFNYFTLLSLSASLMIQQISKLTIELYKPDILISIPMNSYGPFQFYKSKEIIRTGEIATRRALFDYYLKESVLKNEKLNYE